MSDICSETSTDDGCLSEECREARHRRMELRRLSSAMSTDSQPPQAGGAGLGEKRPRETSGEDGGGAKRSRTLGSRCTGRPPQPPSLILSSSSSSSSAAPLSLPSSRSVQSTWRLPAPEAPPAVRGMLADDPPPEFGAVSLSGRSREMEDAVSLHPNFFSSGEKGASPLHFFAVFDGHGGAHVSEMCKERMHVLLADELRKMTVEHGDGGFPVDALTAATARCFRRMDELSLTACACGSVGEPACRCDQAGLPSMIVGSTAIVAVVSRERVLVANCGDSRAVLSRGGRAVPLSSDHKPDRPDEQARIEAAGGRVIHVNGPRLLGILAMSRALGDKYLKPIVIAEPEVNVVERTPDDEFLILASDGLWDVLSSDLACDVARRCLHDRNKVTVAEAAGGGAGAATIEQDASRSYCSVAATLLTRLALGRRSMDNISVVVVDLQR